MLALLGLIGLAALVGYREALRDPVARRLDVAVRGWPDGAPPLRLALLSDIHFGARSMDDARLRRIVAQVNAAHPDIVLLAGDMVIGHDATGADARAAGLTAPLAELRAPGGVIAVLGNHDHWTAPAAIRTALARAGVLVLENGAVRRGPIALLGVDDSYSGHDDVRATLAAWRRIGGLPVVLTHAPDLTARLPHGLPLLLAGHTHCGQVVLPGWGPLLLHSPHEQWRLLYDPRLRCGVVRDAGRTIVVTAGVGSGTMPLRLGAPPDWWLITLRQGRR
ncbi:metallophosphoesterase [Sphingomonas azotifigens]|uniref:metallophosphoesterase n=1 Tax=Sphingomonas azotifigens TaxID=330920 RepID=UPI00157C7D81|nr:metallophosphoesterase [Sphingomonas azotifigens]